MGFRAVYYEKRDKLQEDVLLRRAAEQIQAGKVSGSLNVGTNRTSTNSMGIVNKSRSYSLFLKGMLLLLSRFSRVRLCVTP